MCCSRGSLTFTRDAPQFPQDNTLARNTTSCAPCSHDQSPDEQRSNSTHLKEVKFDSTVVRAESEHPWLRRVNRLMGIVRGQAMVDVMGRVPPSKPDADKTDYGSLFGFGRRGERVNPHEHVAPQVDAPDLAAIVKAVRKKAPVGQAISDQREAETQSE
jgi:hypothetical protein